MVSFVLKNTLSDNGGVTRGVCEVDGHGMLADIKETHNIEKEDGKAVIHKEDGDVFLNIDSPVSMNMWGFTRSILDEIKAGFPAFLDKGIKENPMKCEYFLPAVVSRLLEEDRATVSVLKSHDKWYGITYKEDKPVVVEAMQKMKDNGVYPQHLWK